MYTTHLHDEKIHHDWEKQQMYVEYKEQVLPHIDKIWLSPVRQSTKTTFASCSIKAAVKARFVSPRTRLETRSKGARSLYEGSSST